MKRLILEYWTPLIVWIVTIFIMSTDMMSSGQTSKFIVPLLTFFAPGLSPVQIDFWHFVIRKCGHVTEYFILGILVYRSLKYEHPDLLNARLRAIVFVVAVALLDEYHQSFVPSRGSSLVDVGYDGLGGVSALWMITLYEARRLRSHSIL